MEKTNTVGVGRGIQTGRKRMRRKQHKRWRDRDRERAHLGPSLNISHLRHHQIYLITNVTSWRDGRRKGAVPASPLPPCRLSEAKKEKKKKKRPVSERGPINLSM